MFTDGAARGNPGPAGVGVVIEDDQGLRLRGLHRYIGKATNNEAEYQALIEGLKAVSEWKPDRLEVYLDRLADLVAGVDAQCFSHAARASPPRSDSSRGRRNAALASITSACGTR